MAYLKTYMFFDLICNNPFLIFILSDFCHTALIMHGTFLINQDFNKLNNHARWLSARVSIQTRVPGYMFESRPVSAVIYYQAN